MLAPRSGGERSQVPRFPAIDEEESAGNAPWLNMPLAGFGPGPERRLNAQIERNQGTREGMFRYAEGYRRAASAVFASALTTKEPPEFTVWPLAFLWRHHLELTLKWIIATGHELHGELATFPERHHLDELWRDAKRYIVETSSADAPGIAEVEAAIHDFERIDPGADGFRYPFARKSRDGSLHDAPREVNLRNLHDAMAAVATFLDCAHDMLTVTLDNMGDVSSSGY